MSTPLASHLPKCLVRAALMLGFAVFGASAAAGQGRQAGNAGSCQLEPGGESTVLAVAGPQMLHLADGRSIQLAEILTPPVSGGTGFDPSSEATAYLRSAALGRKVEVKFGGNHRDRYGVTVAHVFVAGEPSLWLQEGLVSAGLALAFPQADNHACSPQLASMEEKARSASRGYWGRALFKVMPADETRSILNLVQTYQIIEGEVTSVTNSGGRTTLHFAGNGKAHFSVSIEPIARKNLDVWPGQRIRVRGWIERKKGPAIAITQPEQIELLQHPPAKSASESSRDK